MILMNTTNPLCPDHTAHYENAAERLGIAAGQIVTADQDEAILAEAELEYRCCEGH